MNSKRIKRGEIQMIVLRVIAVAGIISIAMIAPNALIILKPLLKDKKYTASSYVNRTLDNLQRQELVDFDVRNGVRFYKLTQKGEEQLLKNDIFSIKFFRPKKWDGKWRIVSFDIFEDQRWKRDVLRSYMVKMGFVKIHQSVWLYPYSCKKQLEKIGSLLSIKQYIFYFETRKIQQQKYYKDIFDI